MIWQRKTYVFDIDGTICTLTDGDYEDARPIQGRINKVNDLYEQGHDIVFFTARGMSRSAGDVAWVNRTFYDMTKAQLDSWNVKYHKLLLGKPAADFYVDDKGIRDYDFFAD